MIGRIGRRLWASPWLALGLMAWLSGANGVAARLATGEMPPLLVVVLRWATVCATLAVLFRREQWQALRVLARDRWPLLAWMGLLGYAGFNGLFYVAAYHTSAVNLTLLQSSIPALVLVGTVVLMRQRVRWRQVAGMVLTFFGVLLVSAKGDVSRLAMVRLDAGDGLVLVACLFYALYTLGLRTRPDGSPLVFFAGMAFAAFVWSIPMGIGEVLAGQAYWPSAKGWAIMLFIAFGPSFAGQLCYMRGVDLIGPARAGLCANLIPLTGAICAVIVLHEPFTLADAIALGLGIGGISLAEWPSRRPRNPADGSVQRAGPAGDAALP